MPRSCLYMCSGVATITIGSTDLTVGDPDASYYRTALLWIVPARVDGHWRSPQGDIEFVPDAADTCYDAFMKLGPASYLVLNHTVKTMDEIRADSKWLGAQAVLFELSEKFRADPLELRALQAV